LTNPEPSKLALLRNKKVKAVMIENLKEELQEMWNQMVAESDTINLSELQNPDIPSPSVQHYFSSSFFCFLVNKDIQNVPVFTVSAKEYLCLTKKNGRAEEDSHLFQFGRHGDP
jgi:hypothetical protein